MVDSFNQLQILDKIQVIVAMTNVEIKQPAITT